jgi:nicotinamide mononucleotide transporter
VAIRASSASAQTCISERAAAVILLAQLWEGLKTTGPFEWIANATGVTYVLLVMRHRRAGWVFGGISSAILAVLFWQVHLPMQALLQVTYVLAAVYGWRSWSRASGMRPISVWHWRGHMAVSVGAVLASLLLARLLANESAFPFIDSLVFCAGMFATWLLARVHLENWAYWIAIDAASIYLSFQQGLFSIALLYMLYLCLAVAGLVNWWKTRRKSPA